MIIHKHVFRVWLILIIPAIIAGFYHFYKVEKEGLETYLLPISTNIGKTFTFEYLIDSSENEVKPKLTSDETIVDFWFQQCPRCNSEMTQFESLLKGKEKEISVISISIDNLKEWKELFQKRMKRFDFINARLPNWQIVNLNVPYPIPKKSMDFVFDRFGFSGYPGYFVLDRSGKIKETPYSAVDYIRRSVYGRSAFGIYLSDHGFTGDGLLIELQILLLFTGGFWIIVFVVQYIKSLF